MYRYLKKPLGSRQLLFFLSPGTFLFYKSGNLPPHPSLHRWEIDLALGVNKGFHALGSLLTCDGERVGRQITALGSAGESREAAPSVVVPGPLCAICKPLFHEAALNNLEKPPLFFLFPLSRLAPRCSCEPSPPLPG